MACVGADVVIRLNERVSIVVDGTDDEAEREHVGEDSDILCYFQLDLWRQIVQVRLHHLGQLWCPGRPLVHFLWATNTNILSMQCQFVHQITSIYKAAIVIFPVSNE